MKIFVDTNIFLDLILKREKFHDALLIFNAIEKKLFEGIILDITILNIDYIAKKQVKNIKDFIKIINSSFSIVGISNEMISKALEIENNDFEDTLQYFGAKSADCEYVITNDKSFYKADLKTISSSEFIEKYL
ncbi:PIN domain-containing protein [Aliarcobacter cryaerophilus]|uniref:type II toxin-antitoxin system VapC family toxin n=1 Tax=Aliarcobacter cryaerophilus TaxID=28198 RepID=UPI0021B1DC80|nr:PIN domain-containing protein [Aliarcobacter cryaerophilus]MCT7506226.1 PIN domain-containing protein [Aliarcobacter cryaerophilus]